MTISDTEPTSPQLDTAAQPKGILLVDDHPVFRRGMVALLSEYPEFSVLGESCNSKEALEAMRTLNPDVIMVDISLPGINGIELVKLIVAERPSQLVLMLSMHDESLYAVRALRAGARGYVMKGEALEHIVEALRRVLEGGHYLTPALNQRLVIRSVPGVPEATTVSAVNKLSDREKEVLSMLGKGMSTREIANIFGLSVKTIETHRLHIKEKLGMQDSVELVRFAIEAQQKQDKAKADAAAAEQPT